jgi:hypothetical protein
VAGIGEAGWVHHQAVETFIGCPVNPVDRFAFDVGARDLRLVVVLVSVPMPVRIVIGIASLRSR